MDKKLHKILDLELAILLNEEKTVGSYELGFNAGRLPNGDYL